MVVCLHRQDSKATTSIFSTTKDIIRSMRRVCWLSRKRMPKVQYMQTVQIQHMACLHFVVVALGSLASYRLGLLIACCQRDSLRPPNGHDGLQQNRLGMVWSLPANPRDFATCMCRVSKKMQVFQHGRHGPALLSYYF